MQRTALRAAGVARTRDPTLYKYKAEAIIREVQESHIAGNVPAEADFRRCGVAEATSTLDGGHMAAVVRTVVYLAIIVGLVVIFLPAEILERSGVTRASPMGILQFAGATITLAGVGLALWCALTFAVVGRGTPLPFDPPRRLVIAGPYRSVRNPMAIGAGSALVGVALFYESLPFLLFAGLFMLAIHAFVVLYKEPTLRRTFGAQYAAYCARVSRWLPRRPVSTQVGDGSDGIAA